ncbi:carotenoid oxygenase family protein [Saccharopolyspora sp. HNM0986]|uniref:carotenoid oxygenase family protein n=1 Tax=Saccharopolyspora galaxeae TaxID=2781241 RepID=UPI00190DAD4C|nr:carotenoid oxygenase family protein [Saccharopolyspora sp. HNM0986]MBK0869875.1 carotenoid oxygenase family protein [Saccharopolyspora sp. HNM0986]
MSSNDYLNGSFAPVEDERTLTEPAVTGSIPQHLDGRYLRNGPNPMREVDPAAYHWFMGDGMVHGIRLREGRAEWYRNRWVRSPDVAAALGEPRRNGRSRRAGLPSLGANTNVIGHAGRTLALIEGGVANYELTDTLDTVGPCDFDGTLPGGYTAHPKRDPDTGELHAVSYFFGRGNTVQYSVIGTDGRCRRAVDIEVTGSPMMHDFSLTRDHVVFYDLPVTFDVERVARATVPPLLRTPAKLVLSAVIGRVRVPDPIAAMAAGRFGANTGLPYRWNRRYPARIGVMPRDGGNADVRWFEVEPCYVFHPMNAYDDGATVVLDVVRHPKMFDTDLHGPNEGTPTLDRWTVDLAAGRVREERLDDRAQEFPRVDERRVGRAHRYGYAPEVGRGLEQGGALLKHDLQQGRTTERRFGAGVEVGEFVFEPSSPDAAEDDGVLMGFAYDRAAARSDLMILDAASLETVAAVHLPVRVPNGFHGNWVPTGA